MIVVYFLACSITYLRNKNKILLTQVQISKLTMRVLINHLDDAIFLKSDQGQLSYCNDQASKIINSTCAHLFLNDAERERYLNRLQRMNLIVKNFFKNDQNVLAKNESNKDDLVLNMPFLKLYMNNSSNEINRTNQTLTAQQQINLTKGN